MQKNWMGLALLLVGVTFSGAVRGETDEDLVSRRVKQMAPAVPAAHPRLLLIPADLPALREFIAREREDAAGRQLWQRIAIGPDAGTLPPEPQRVPSGGKQNAEAARIWQQSYQAANNAGNTALRQAFMYQVTGDPRHGREAARWLVHLAGWSVTGGIDIRNNDEAFIQVLRPMIFAYDWAHDALTPEERLLVQKVLKERLDILWRDISRLFRLQERTAPSNSLSHPMRFISTVGLGGLALFGEVGGADRYLAWTHEYYSRQFPVWGGDDGGWSEGIDYWATGLTQHLRFLDALQLLGMDEPLKRPFFRNNGYFGLYNLLPYEHSSFGDLTNLTRPNPNRALLVEKYGLLYGDPYLMAYSRLLGSRHPEGFNYYEFNAIDTLLHRFRSGQKRVPEGRLADLPQSRYFADIGWVAMHSKLGDKDNDIMLGFKSSPFGSASHSFSDQNSFVLNAYGQPLAISSGYREWYDSKHHLGWTRTTAAKNAILIDGEGQPLKDAGAYGYISRFLSDARYDFATGDASAAYRSKAEQALRHVFFVNRRYFIVADELTARRPARFAWLLHAREEMTLDATRGLITSRKGGASVQVHFIEPAAHRLGFTQTNEFAVPVDQAYATRMPKEWHARAELIESVAEGRFLTLLYPARDGEAGAALRVQDATQGSVFSVRSKDVDDLVLWGGEKGRRVESGKGAMQGLAAVFSKSEDVERMIGIELRQARVGDIQFAADKPLSFEMARNAGGTNLILQPHESVELRLALSKPPVAVQGARTWRFEASTKTLVMALEAAAGMSELTIR